MLATCKMANGILPHDTCKNNRLILSKGEHLSHHHNFSSENYSLIVTCLHEKDEKLPWLVCLTHLVFNHRVFLLFVIDAGIAGDALVFPEVFFYYYY